jgi:predicted Zn-dependent peptidase
MIKKVILKSGLRVVLSSQKNSSAITILVLVGTGSEYETKTQSGISHFLEHLLFKGTEKRPNHLAISEPLDEVGGVYNAFTSEEYTGYYVKVEKKHFPLALDILSDIYLNSKLDKEEIEKERGVIIEEINMYQDHPSSYVQILFNEILYGDQPAGWSIAGTKEIVSGISRQALVEYKQNQYTASNTVVCVAGGIESEKNILAQIEKSFSGINKNKNFIKPAVKEFGQKSNCLLQTKETDQCHICLGGKGYGLNNKERYAQDVLATALGGMMSSRLFVRIREELGLAYHISAGSNSFTDHGYFVIQAGVDNNKVEKAIIAILTELKKVASRGIAEQELNKAKDNLKGKMALMLETSDSFASFYGLQEILEKDILTSKQICDKIDKVGTKEVSAVAKEIFRPGNLKLALIGPFKDNIKFEKLLSA